MKPGAKHRSGYHQGASRSGEGGSGSSRWMAAGAQRREFANVSGWRRTPVNEDATCARKCRVHSSRTPVHCEFAQSRCTSEHKVVALTRSSMPARKRLANSRRCAPRPSNVSFRAPFTRSTRALVISRTCFAPASWRQDLADRWHAVEVQQPGKAMAGPGVAPS